MKKSIIEMVAGLLVWSVLIIACAIDLNHFWYWLKIEFFLVIATIGWWKLFNLPNPFEKDNEKA